MLKEFVKKVAKMAADNSPTILTAAGVTGTVVTAILAGRAAFKTAEIITREEYVTGEPMDVRERLEFVKETGLWQLYLPAVGTGAATVLAVVYANHVGTRRAAAMAAAYTISERTLQEYQDKIAAKFGEKRATTVRDEIAQDRIDANPTATNEVIIAGGDVLCYDAFTGRYFMSTIETIKRAENEINYRILNELYASLTDFYQEIGLPRTSHSDELGWKTGQKFRIDMTAGISDDGRPCIHIQFSTSPIRDYYRLG